MKKKICLSILLVFALLIFSPLSAFSAAPISERGYADSEALISAEELAEIRESDDVKVIDFRNNVQYLTGHIPGAIQLSRSELEDQDAEYQYFKASPEQVERVLRENGIRETDLVVAYDDINNLWASRVWWLLKMYGHENVRLLDGGLGRWEELGYDTRMIESVSYPESDYQIDSIDEYMVSNMQEVYNAIDREDSVILDVRAWEEFTGEQVLDGSGRGGRIPSSVWIEWTEVLNADGTFKNAAELEELFLAEGVSPDKVIYPYCQGAIRSAHTTFALKALLGYPEVKNYDGSWVEWSNEDMPVEVGE